MKNWLDKYKDGGPIQENYNDASASVGPGYVGLAYDTTGRNYSPAWGGQFAMGGSIPGATGMMYARTQNPAPSNGKYAKKTMPSAQNGKEMQFYQEGLDWEPKSISRNGGNYISRAEEGMEINDCPSGYFKDSSGKCVPFTSMFPSQQRATSESTRVPQRDYELESDIRVRNAIANQPQLKQARTLTAYEEAVRKSKNKAYAVKNPNAAIDEEGNIVAKYADTDIDGRVIDKQANRQRIISSTATALSSPFVAAGVLGAGAAGASTIPYITPALNAPLLGSFGTQYGASALTASNLLGLGFGLSGANKLGTDINTGYYSSNAPVLDKITRGVETGMDLGFSPGVLKGLGAGYNALKSGVGQSMESGLLSKLKPIETPSVGSVENTVLPKITSDQWKEMSGYLQRRQFLKGLQKEGLVGKKFNLADINYTARSTNRTNKLTQLALDRRHTGFRNVTGNLPVEGKGRQNYTGYPYDMNRPAWGQNISEFENMKNAAVDFNDPKSIAEYQATYIPLEDYGYRSTGEHPTDEYGFLFRSPNPSNSTEYGNFQFKGKPNLDFTLGDYADWFKKYHSNLDYHLKRVDNFNYQMRDPKVDDLSKTVIWKKTIEPSINNSTLVGPRGTKAFEIDKEFPFQNLKNLTSEELENHKKYIQNFQNQYNTGWRGEYKKGGLVKAQNGKQVPIAQNGGWLDKYYDGGVIKDDRGQWDHPGEITEIGSNNITMQGVPYDVLGISDTGDTKLMKPGQDYKFKGKKVTEYPMAKNGINLQDEKVSQQLDQLTNFTNYNKPTKGGWLDKYN